MKTKLVDLMMGLGMSRTSATMALPMMWVTPAITDRYSNSTIAIVQTLQRHFGLPATGQIDAGLATALESCCGRAWQTMTWVKIYRRVAASPRRPVRATGGAAMGAFWDDAIAAVTSITGGGDEDFAVEEPASAAMPWCSTSHPNGTCTPIRGVCKPMTAAAAELYKTLQGQLNRVAHKQGWATIAVDGRPGRQTVTLCNKALGTGFSSCDELCANATKLTMQASSLASNMGAPSTVPSPAPKAPPSSGVAGGVYNPTSASAAGIGGLSQLVGFATSPAGLLLIAGFAAWKGGFLDGKPTKKKPRRRKTAPKSRRAKSRRAKPRRRR